MPGPKKGQRFGGRSLGTPNKRTIEKKLEEARAAAEIAQQPSKKLAKHVLEDFMHLTAGIAAFYQPSAPNDPNQNPNQNEDKFWKAADAALAFAKALAPYQSPTFKAIQVHAPPQERPPQPGDKAKDMGNVIDITDHQAVMRIYKLTMKGGVVG